MIKNIVLIMLCVVYIVVVGFTIYNGMESNSILSESLEDKLLQKNIRIMELENMLLDCKLAHDTVFVCDTTERKESKCQP